MKVRIVNRRHRHAGLLKAACVAMLLFSVILSGCVERRLFFTSDLEDTPVIIELNGEVIGEAPVSVKFIHYGNYEWVARAQGYEISSGEVNIKAPWYQYPPMDFFAEAVIPWTVHDDRSVSVAMRPLSSREEDDTLLRAKAMRAEALEKLAAESKFKSKFDRPGNAPKPVPDDESSE